MYKKSNLTTIAKKQCSGLQGKVQLKMFTGEAATNPTLLEKKKKAVAEMASFKGSSVDIIGFNRKKKK